MDRSVRVQTGIMPVAVILGCGYTGRVLARQLGAQGWTVRGTTTRSEGLPAIEATGAFGRVARLDDVSSLRPALEGADVVFHLAPPPRDGRSDVEWRALQDALPANLDAFVYGSTTGAFGSHGDAWIDEDTPSVALKERGQRRLDYEQGLAGIVRTLRVVRIAGIYGPGRTIWASLQRPGFVLFEGGPATSRIHVEDLAALLAAMGRSDAPPLAVGCDDLPAPTLEVARFVCRLLGASCPEPVSLVEARARMSPTALELRLGGRRCRSKVRPALIGSLRYPTFKTGMEAALRAEGLLGGMGER